MADNIQLNPGADGATVRTLADSSGTEWPVGVTVYATHLEDGANVLQVVDAAHPLPVTLPASVSVTNDDPADLLATVSIAAGQTIDVGSITNPVAVTQSGTWSFDLDSVAVDSIASPVEVVQDTPGDLLATAYQGGTWTVGVSGTVAVSIADPVTVNLSAAQTLAAVTSITNPVAVTQSGSWAVTAAIDGSPEVSLAEDTTVSATQSGPWEVSLADGSAVDATVSGTLTTVGTITNPVAVSSIGAGTALVGKVASGQDTSTLYNGTTALTPKFAKIAASSSGDNTVVAAVTGKKIRVLRWGLTSNGTVSAKWRSNTTDVTGPRYLVQYASAGGSYCPVGIFETAAGEALSINLSAAVACGGELAYIEV